MQLFEVYQRFDIEPFKARDVYIWDSRGTRYLDLYGGHAVISIGHNHPHYLAKLRSQLETIGFYSNALHNSLQIELAEKLGELSGYSDYRLFLCNSGAEANENALKCASFHNRRKKIVAFRGAFHGRTSAAVAATDNPAIRAPLNDTHEVVFLPLNDAEALEKTLLQQDVCAVIVEGIQGVGGVHPPEAAFLRKAETLCRESATMLILDEIQSGYGRCGKFFAHQYAGIRPDLITVAKGMGNGFPIAGVLIHPKIRAAYGMLGSTFGGNQLACAAAIAVLDIIREEQLIEHAGQMGNYLIERLKQLDRGIREVRGAGLMIAIELHFPAAALRKQLLFEHQILSGSASDQNTIRILPPLTLQKKEADIFLKAFGSALSDFKPGDT